MIKIAFSITLVIFSVSLVFMPVQIFEMPILNTFKVAFSMVLAFLAVAFVFDRNMVDPESCKQNWCVVLTILGSVALIIGENRAGLLVFSIMLLGVGINSLFIALRSNQKQQKKGCANVNRNA